MKKIGPRVFTRVEESAIEASAGDSIGTPDRLCAHDHACGHGDAGCRRSDTILAFEAEFDTFVKADMQWGARDQFFYHEGHIYYYKPYLKEILDFIAVDGYAELDEAMAKIREIYPAFEHRPVVPTTLAEVRAVIDAAPAGMPKFVVETPHFYQFEDVGHDLVTGMNVDRETLNIIEATFTGDYVPEPFVLHDAYYIKDSKAYWTDLTRWADNHANLQGDVGLYLGEKFYTFINGRSDEVYKLLEAVSTVDPFKVIDL